MTGARIERIALITDFGHGLYVGQVRARLAARLPGVGLVDLVHDLAPFRPDLAAYLLPALVRDMPRGTLYLCVVDPGVGSERDALALEADGDWFIGPDNGLFSRLAERAGRASAHRIGWRPEGMSPSFHGRDWFAPAAARLCLGEDLGLRDVPPTALAGADWPDDLQRIVYTDRFGNLITGARAERLPGDTVLRAGGHRLRRARTFSDVAPGQAFWYEDAFGLVELAVNQGRADRLLGLGAGDPVEMPVFVPVPERPR